MQHGLKEETRIMKKKTLKLKMKDETRMKDENMNEIE